MLKLKMILCVLSIAAGRRRLHIVVCQSVREATTASGVDNAASPRLAERPLNRIIRLRETDLMQKQLEGPREILLTQCRWGALCQ